MGPRMDIPAERGLDLGMAGEDIASAIQGTGNLQEDAVEGDIAAR